VWDVTIDVTAEPVAVLVAVAAGKELTANQKDNIEKTISAAFPQFEIE